MTILSRLKVLLTADTGEFKKELEGAETTTGKFSKGLGNMFGALGLGAIGLGTLVTGLKYVVGASSEAEVIQAQLNAVLESTGFAAGLTADELNDLALELSRLTGIEDDAISKAQAVMLTFTKISEDVFPAAMTAAANMSTALGQDLQSSVIQLGKALNDPIQGVTALQRVGVSFTKAQREQIKALVDSGRAMEAQQLILAELEVEFGGAAEAMADTFSGAIKRITNEFGNMAETVGGGLTTWVTPALNAFATALGNVVDRHTMVNEAVAKGLMIKQFGMVYRSGSIALEDLVAMLEEYDRAANATSNAELVRAGVYTQKVIPALEDTEGAEQRVASAMWDTAEAAGPTSETVALSFSDMADAANSSLDSIIANMMADMQWIAAGGLELQQAYGEVINRLNVDTLNGVEYAAANAYGEMQELQVASIVLKDELAKIDTTETAENISSTLGISLQAALTLVNQIRANAEFDVTSYVRVVYSEEHGAERTGESRVGGEIGLYDDERAYGGPVSNGKTYLVGENGPELLTMGTNGGGYVTPMSTNNNYYTMNVNTNAPSSTVTRDFEMMRSREGAN